MVDATVRRFPARLLVAAVLALTLIGGLIGGFAYAQVVQVKHVACYSNTANPWEDLDYLPPGVTTCPPNWTKIDWVDD